MGTWPQESPFLHPQAPLLLTVTRTRRSIVMMSYKVFMPSFTCIFYLQSWRASLFAKSLEPQTRSWGFSRKGEGIHSLPLSPEERPQICKAPQRTWLAGCSLTVPQPHPRPQALEVLGLQVAWRSWKDQSLSLADPSKAGHLGGYLFFRNGWDIGVLGSPKPYLLCC